MPVCAAVVACVAFFYEPLKGQATSTARADGSQKPVNSDVLEQKLKELRKKPDPKAEEKAKSEEIERLEAELDKIANRPRDTKDALRERIKDMTALEETMKTREKELAEKTQSLKQQLQQLDKLSQQGKDGPARDLEKALAEGKLDKASEQIDKLMKKLQNNELTPREKEKLQQELQDLQKKLEQLAQQKDREELLKKANLDPETLKREMKRLQEEKSRLKDLQNLANKLGAAQKALQEGKMDDATEALKSAADSLKGMELDQESLENLRESLARLQDTMDSACECLGEGKPSPMITGNYSEKNDGGVGAGRRPLG